jgi:hypothetical protein
VEYAGNSPFTSPYGDVSTGKVEGSSMGYGISAGKGVIWVCMPYLNNAGAKNVNMWWGDPPKYQVQPTIDYCIATVKTICERYGGDPAKVFLAGFSRGSIACNYIGLQNDQVASLWRGFICYANYVGLHPSWPYPDDDRATAAADEQGAPAGAFRKQGVLAEPGDGWDAMRLDDPCAVLDGDTVHVFFKGFDNNRNRDRVRVGYARAALADLKFTKHPEPILAVAGGGGSTWRHYVSDDGLHWRLYDANFFGGHPTDGPRDIMMIHGMNGTLLE